MQNYRPFVSILLVNYNGCQLLRECLPALFEQDYGADNFEVIVVDNNSTDNSCSFIKRSYKDKVRLLESTSNLGFTGGNNLAYKYAHGDSIVLLNTDVVVTKNWLSELVKASEPENVGLAASKLFFSTPFLPLTIQTPVIQRSQIDNSIDFSPMGVMLENISCDTQRLTDLVWYKKGFSEPKVTDIVTRWTTGDAQVNVPFQIGKKQQSYTLTLHGYETDQSISIPYKVMLGEEVLIEGVLAPKQVAHQKLAVPATLAEKHFVWHVQNAGNVVLHDGYSKDRGSLLRLSEGRLKEFYEEDSQYFSKPRKILAVCGASCLIKRKVIEEIGLFDGFYYMYYEDLDLSLRAWRSGYDLVYAPSSIGFHKHRATTGQTISQFFLQQTERNHLYFLFTHFPWPTVMIESVLFLLRLTISGLNAGIMRFSENLARYNRALMYFDARKQVFKDVLGHLSSLLHNRRHWAKVSQRGYNEMKEFMY